MARSSTRTERLAIAVALCLSGCCSDEPDSAKAADKGARQPSGAEPVVVVVSVDWEGAYFEEDALATFGQFRTENPDVPITHLICPAYYTKLSAQPTEVTFFLRKNQRKGDEVGLHLHMWNSLVQAAKVPVRTGWTFLPPDGRLMDFEGDAGFDLDPAVYTVTELRSVVAHSRRLLTDAGFQVAPVFRAPGWLGVPTLLEAVRAEGFTVDSSAIDPSWIGDSPGEEELKKLSDRLREIWPKVDRTTQPHVIDTPAGPLLELPDSGAMADVVTSEEMEDHVQWAAHQTKRPMFVHLGFYAETAHNSAPLLSRALANLRRRKVPMRFVTASRAAQLAKKGLGVK